MAEDGCMAEKAMRLEEQVTERTDDRGQRWEKIYFGGGAHFNNWLQQCEEVYGKENVQVEEADPKGLICYEEGGEKMYRIWVKAKRPADETE